MSTYWRGIEDNSNSIGSKEKFDDISRAIEEISIEYFDTLPSEVCSLP